MEFGNPIVGDEDLIRSAIKSPDFSSDPETGVQGWRIARDGSATFYNLSVGSPNFTIDENGNAVFASVTADEILLDGTSLADTLAIAPKGMIALNTLPNDTAAYDGNNEVLFGRVIIPNFDSGRQYRISFIGRINMGTSTPSFVVIRCRFEWGSETSASSSLLFDQQQGGRNTSSASDWITSGNHVIKNSSPPSTDLHLGFYLFASTSGCNYQGTDYGRIWIEDLGPSIPYGTWTPSTPATQQYVKTYNANGSASHQGDGTNRNVSECYQGQYSSTNGNQFSVITFPISTIQSDLSGSTIDKVELYLNNNHWYNNSGGTAVIGTHPYTSPAGDSNYGDLNPDITRKTFSYGQAKWVTVPNSIGAALRDNTAKGICLGKGRSTSKEYYGYFAGNGQSGEPRLRITYTK